MTFEQPSKPGGFTLIEMVIAIGIFAIIAVICFATLNNFIDTRDQIAEKDQRLRQLQTLVAVVERDIRFVVNRPVRDPDDGDPHPALQSQSDDPAVPGEILRLTVSVPQLDSPIEQLTRVAYRLDGTDLYRVTWNVLDPVHDSETTERLLYKGLHDFAVRFYEKTKDSQTPGTSFNWIKENALPDAVELLITTDDSREYRRLLEVSRGA